MSARRGLRRVLVDLCLEHAAPWALRYGRLNREQLGRCAEAYVARRLLDAGWRLLGRRVQGPGAELDIVAIDRADLVGIEVKAARLSSAGLDVYRPGQRLDEERLAAQRAALAGLAASLPQRPSTRIDLVELCLPAGGGAPRCIHHRDLQHSLKPPAGNPSS